MTDIIQVTRWRTADGVEHDSERLASAHVKFRALAIKLDHDIYLRDDVDPEAVLKWIVGNKAAVIELLGLCS